MDGVIEKYKLLLEKAAGMAEKVTLSSILPRKDKATEKVDILNAGLVTLCDDLPQVEYINNDPLFKLQDGEINDGYLIGDGPHLTKSGTNKLARTLKLKPKGKISQRTQLKMAGKAVTKAFLIPTNAQMMTGTEIGM